jgi:hypothetical protein
MSTPLTNDFGKPISKDKARTALKAAGWQLDYNFLPLGPFWYNFNFCLEPLTLREAWAEHKAGGSR